MDDKKRVMLVGALLGVVAVLWSFISRGVEFPQTLEMFVYLASQLVVGSFFGAIITRVVMGPDWTLARSDRGSHKSSSIHHHPSPPDQQRPGRAAPGGQYVL